MITELELEIRNLKKDLEVQEYAYSRLNEEFDLEKKRNEELKDCNLILQKEYQTKSELLKQTQEYREKDFELNQKTLRQLESQKFLNKQLSTSNSKLNSEIQDMESSLLSAKHMMRIEVSEREKIIKRLFDVEILLSEIRKSNTFWKALAYSASIFSFLVSLFLLLTLKH